MQLDPQKVVEVDESFALRWRTEQSQIVELEGVAPKIFEGGDPLGSRTWEPADMEKASNLTGNSIYLIFTTKSGSLELDANRTSHLSFTELLVHHLRFKLLWDVQ